MASKYTFNYDGVDLGEGRLVLPKCITSTDEGRVWFARGWLHVLNYNHEEAIACFSYCSEIDPTCMMAFWGLAYALSSSYNLPCGLGCGFDAIQAAVAGIQLSPTGTYSELEEDLIRALAARSSPESKAAINPAKMNFGNTPELNQRYAEGMGQVYAKHEGNLDVAALYAEALMVLKPWALWVKDDNNGDITPADHNTLMVKDVLTRAMEAPGGMKHPAILHLFCHLMELSSEPTMAMDAADALRTLFPSAGHLTHMASHIDIWAGQYKEAVDANMKAIEIDEETVRVSGAESNFFKVYRMHNIHMAIWAAMFTGQKDIAMRYSRMVDATLPRGDATSGVQHMLLGCIPLGQCFLEPYTMIKWHVMIRFGMWDEILAEPQHEDINLYAAGISAGYYARGLAYAVKGLIKEAEAEQAKYVELMKHPAMEGKQLNVNFLVTKKGPGGVLEVGESMLAGEIEYRKGNFEVAFGHLREAVRRDVGLVYEEPWAWMMPAAHALGALLLEQGQVMAATEVFRSDVERYKDNMWGLLGLYQCLQKVGDPEADEVRQRFDKASITADEKPAATCFCAKVAGASSPMATAPKTCCQRELRHPKETSSSAE